MFIPEVAISGEKVFEISGVSITNTSLWALFLAAGVFLLFFLGFKRLQPVPGNLQNFLEFILESLYNFIDSITGEREATNEIFPLAATLFILILSANLLELIPGLGVFHFLRSPSSDLNFTFALALFSMFLVNVYTIKKIGPFSYLKKFLNLKSPISFFVGLLEGIGEVTRILSLAFRLFGNLFAGETLLIITSFLFAYILPLPFLGLEILVGFIQAFIFSSLIVIFYTTSIRLEYEK